MSVIQKKGKHMAVVVGGRADIYRRQMFAIESMV